jgi:hypothetical protein
LLGIRERVGHGHERQPTSAQGERAGIDVADQPLDRARAAGLVAVHGAENDERRAGPEAGVADGLERWHRSAAE